MGSKIDSSDVVNFSFRLGNSRRLKYNLIGKISRFIDKAFENKRNMQI